MSAMAVMQSSGANSSPAARERVAAGVSRRPGEGLRTRKDIAHSPPHPNPLPVGQRVTGRIHGAEAKTRLHWVSVRPAFLIFEKETAGIFCLQAFMPSNVLR